MPDEPMDQALDFIAQALAAMPAEGFQQRLKGELQMIASMPTVQSVTPCIVHSGGDKLVEFVKRAFGAEETFRTASAAGLHVEARIGGAPLMIGSAESKTNISAFHLYVPDCDAVYRRAVEAGAVSMGEPADRPYGERSGFVKDFAGNHWYIATMLKGPFAPETYGTLMPYLFPARARAFIDFARRAFAAEEIGVYEHEGRVMHAAIRMGGSVVEMGESPETPPMHNRLFLQVEDCDAVYARAIGAGATSVQGPADMPYGLRTAVVLDPFGFEWLAAAPVK
jgi:uncharacterized glyoxalase superfamily protein PhnB